MSSGEAPVSRDILAHGATLQEAAAMAQRVEEHLRATGFLDPAMGVREERSARDPMLTVLYEPRKVAVDENGRHVLVINSLLRSAHAHMATTYGSLYTEAELIQSTMKTLLGSDDAQAKIVMFLCMLTIDEQLQMQFASLYPPGAREASRLAPLIETARAQMQEVLNTAYVNVERPHRYNIDTLVEKFLRVVSREYRG